MKNDKNQECCNQRDVDNYSNSINKTPLSYSLAEMRNVSKHLHSGDFVAAIESHKKIFSQPLESIQSKRRFN